jgi:hypothetical protein
MRRIWATPEVSEVGVIRADPVRNEQPEPAKQTAQEINFGHQNYHRIWGLRLADERKTRPELRAVRILDASPANRVILPDVGLNKRRGPMRAPGRSSRKWSRTGT